jgi:hypothetical protein
VGRDPGSLDSKLYAPSGRFGMTAVYVELEDSESIFNSKERAEDLTKEPITLMRKYMYFYGGFSNECTTACFDTWRYEIAYAPYAYYPKPTAATYTRPGNYWEQ